MTPAARRILVVGGYGVFGSRIAERLARVGELDIVVAGRDGTRATETAAALRAAFPAAVVSNSRLDAETATAADIRTLGAGIVVNASGPFQTQGYALARAAIGAGAHYIDLADARTFVTGIAVLDASAREAGVLVVSGASSVPGLSSAIVRHLMRDIATPETVDIAISPGNSFDPGLATTQSILRYVGRPIRMLVDGRWRNVHGWQGSTRHTFPHIGSRWLGYADVPDLDLFPAHYPTLRSVRFRAGVEVAMFHLGMWAISWGVRLRLVRAPERFARPLLAVKRWLAFLGSDRGGMMVRLSGRDHAGEERTLSFDLEAGSGHGPYIPGMASVILATRLARGEMTERGAEPCFDMFTLDDFAAAVADLDISWQVRESAATRRR